MGESGRAVFRDERVAVALAQSHENLAAASCRFEEAQERSASLLGELRGWLDSFTGTARPEDVNPIAAMLPDEGVENEVVGLMTDCQVKVKRCMLPPTYMYQRGVYCRESPAQCAFPRLTPTRMELDDVYSLLAEPSRR